MTGVDRHFACEDVFRRLDDFLDRELSPEEARLVEEHLSTCAQCASEHRFERRVLDEVRGKLQRIRAPEGLMDRVKQTIKDI